MKYDFECLTRKNDECKDWAGIYISPIGDYIEAEDEKEALELAIDYLLDASRENGFEAEYNKEAEEIIYTGTESGERQINYGFKISIAE